MTRFFLLTLASSMLALASASSQESDATRFSLVRLEPHGEAQIGAVAELGIDHFIRSDLGMVGVLSGADIAEVRRAGIAVTVLVDDLEQHYAERSARDFENLRRTAPNLMARPSARVANFALGSVGGFLNPSELELQLASMSAQFPRLASEPEVIGRTHQGREMLAVRISARPIDDTTAPRALFTAMHHAREPQAMMSVLYSMWGMLEGYGVDPEITWLLDNRVLYFIPLVNVDGWAYNVQRSPSGGGLWRKNMRANGDSAVDLNRNYGPREYWNHAGGGSSTNRLSDTYRGTAPFSEPETQAIRDFVTSRRPNVALNHHTFSNLFIQSDAIVTMSAADSAYFRIVTPAIARAVGYAPGGDKVTVGYQARGTSDDWMFSFGRADGHVFAWTPESGNDEDGFWPGLSRIVPIADWNHRMNLRLAWAAGAAPTIVHTSWYPTVEGSAVRVAIANIGRVAMDDRAWLSIDGSDRGVWVPALRPAEVLAFELALPDSITGGSNPRPAVLVRTRYHDALLTDTVRPLVHPAVTLFEDYFEGGLSQWDPGLYWETERKQNSNVASDSPGRDYFITGHEVNALTTAAPISLEGYDGAELVFDASYAVEGRFHDARVEARRVGELEWYPVDGVGMQVPVTHITTYRNHFRGDGRTWSTYSARLDDYLDETIELRFVVETDETQFAFDGLYVDNVRVLATPPVISGAEVVADAAARLMVSPNPFRDALTLQLPIPHAQAEAHLVDPLGAVVARASGIARVTFDTRGLPAGAYTVVVNSGYRVLRERVVLAR